MKRYKRQSLSQLNRRTGAARIPRSWVYCEELSALFNAALNEFVFTYAKASWRVFFNGSRDYHGRCFTNQRMVTVIPSTTLETLAHEAAHVVYDSHGPKHKALTVIIHVWMLNHWTEYV